MSRYWSGRDGEVSFLVLSQTLRSCLGIGLVLMVRSLPQSRLRHWGHVSVLVWSWWWGLCLSLVSDIEVMSRYWSGLDGVVFLSVCSWMLRSCLSLGLGLIWKVFVYVRSRTLRSPSRRGGLGSGLGICGHDYTSGYVCITLCTKSSVNIVWSEMIQMKRCLNVRVLYLTVCDTYMFSVYSVLFTFSHHVTGVINNKFAFSVYIHIINYIVKHVKWTVLSFTQLAHLFLSELQMFLLAACAPTEFCPPFVEPLNDSCHGSIDYLYSPRHLTQAIGIV